MDEIRATYRTKLFAALVTATLIWALLAGLTANVSANRGGGDLFGYSWTDSNAPSPSVAFDWVDITGVGIDSGVTGDDHASSAIPLGFTFPFYGAGYTEVYFSTNGLITLGSGSTEYSNDPIPSGDAPNLFVAPFWDDLCVDYSSYNSGKIYYQSLGSSPNRQFVVEWWQVSRLSYTQELTFEAILNETGEIWFQYLEMNGFSSGGATIGLENSAGSMGSQYSYNSPGIVDSLAIMFTWSPIGIFPSAQTDACHPGDSAYYEITIANNRAITDSFDLEGVSDAGWSCAFLDGSYTPLTDSNSNGVPDTGDIHAAGTVDIIVRIDVPASPAASSDNTTVIVTSYVDSDDSTAVKVTTEVIVARFSPPHTDFGDDTDMDGQYDYLEVDVEINVTFGGYISLEGYLSDPMWSYINHDYFDGYVDPGEHTIELSFKGWQINLFGTDGTYYVELFLYDSWHSSLDYDLHTTNTYNPDQFEEPPAALEPPYSDHGADYDANGYYDALILTVPVNVTESGDFEFEVHLWDDMFMWVIAEVHFTTHLEVGLQDVDVAFDGRDIRDEGYSGRFGVEINLGTDLSEFLDYDWHYTNLYWAAEFEPPGAYLALSHSEQGLDTNGNGFYDYFAVEVSVHVTRAGVYTIGATLYDMWPTYITEGWNTSYLETGIQTVELLFSGKSIYYYGYDGPFGVHADLYEDDMDWIHEAFYYTDPYLHTDFEPPGAALEAPHSDWAVDTNGNGYYDWLIINVSVNVSMEGIYLVVIDLYDWWPSYITAFSNETYLTEGKQMVEFAVPGILLYQGWYDGPYRADISLWDEEAFYLDVDSYMTSGYLYDEFEPPGARFSPPHEDTGIDSDGDGLYDFIAINVSVNVSTPGVYVVQASLWPAGAYNLTEAYLEAGIQVMELRFDGRRISADGYDGHFDVDMYLMDSDWNVLDYEYYVTDIYSSDQFEASPVEFSPPHSDRGLDVSGGDDFEYLVVDAEIEVHEAGIYTIGASAFGSGVAYYQIEEYLASGSHTVSLMFPAWLLYSSHHTGTYIVGMEIYDQEGIFWDGDTHTTGYYGYDEFNGTPPMISSGWTDAAPTIDGILEPGEWNSASAVNLVESDPANRLEAVMTIMNNATHLFVCYDVIGDTTDDMDDASSFSFDTGNDGIATDGGEDQFVMYSYPDATIHYEYDSGWWDAHCSPFNPSLYNHKGLAGAYGFGPSELETGDHRVFEYSIPLALIGALPGDTLGFCGIGGFMPAVSDWSGWYSTWPFYYTMIPDIKTYGDLELAPLRPLTTAALEGTMGEGDWYVSDVSVALHSSGGDGGVDHTMYRVNGGSWQTYSGEFDLSAQGSVLVEFYSVDMMGNVEDVKSVSFMTDTAAPETSHDAVEGYEVTLMAVDETSGLQSTYYRIDGDVWTMYTGPFTVDDSWTSTVEYYSVDNAGNVESTKSVDLDEVLAPNTIASLIGGKGLGDIFVSPSVMIVLMASDNAGGSGLASTMYRLDGGAWTEYQTEGVEVDGDGNHTVEFYSVDNAGNEESPSSVGFVIDSTAPATTATVVGTNVTLSASDAESGVDSTMYRIDGGDWAEYDGVFSVAAPGNHTVDFYSVDAAGNVEMVDSVTLQNAPEEEEDGGGTSAIVSAVIGLVIGAVVVAAIMMLLMRKKQPGTPAQVSQEPALEEDLPPPPT